MMVMGPADRAGHSRAARAGGGLGEGRKEVCLVYLMMNLAEQQGNQVSGLSPRRGGGRQALAGSHMPNQWWW